LKIKIIILCLIAFTRIFGEVKVEHSQDKRFYIPIYEKTPVLKLYYINQPIKYAMSWTPIALGTIIFGTNCYVNYKRNRNEHFVIDESFVINSIILSAVASSSIGLYKGVRAEREKKRNPNYYIPEDRIGFEGSFQTAYHTMTGAMMLEINYYTLKFGFNEIRILGASSFITSLDNETEFREQKLSIGGLKYSSLGRLFSRYYGLGAGFSYAVDDLAFYPICNATAGVKMSIFDFLHVKLFADFELSSYYLFEQMGSGVDILSKMNIGMGVGAKLF
jgi:hypothetical protein